MPFYCITGDRKSGKTTLISQIADILQQNNVQIKGFWQPRCDEGYDLKLINGETMPLCRKKEGWWFNEDAFIKSSEVLLTSITDIDVVLVDELGWMEVREKRGHWSGFVQSVQHHSDATWILSLRDDCTELLMDELGRKWDGIISLDKQHPNAAEIVKKWVTK